MKSLLIAVSFLWGCQTVPAEKSGKPPLAPVAMVTENYFGKEVADPYRYMENLSDSTFTNWLKGQATYARKVLNGIPGRKGLLDKLREFDERKSVRIFGVSVTENDMNFYLKATPEDETGKLFFREGFSGTESLLFDPEKYGNDTLQYTINSLEPSRDGSKIAFEIAPNGSESSELLIMDTRTKKLFPEVIDRCWDSGVSWLDDDRFLYLRWNSSDVHNQKRLLNSQSFLHTVGQSPESDREVFSKQKYPDLGIREEEYAMVRYDKNTHNLFAMPLTDDRRMKVWVAPASEIDSETIPWKPLFKQEDEVYDFFTSKDAIFAYTPKDAPNFKLIKTPLANPDLANGEVIVPESKEGTLDSYVVTSDGIYYTVSRNGVSQELYLLPNGKSTAKKVKLPRPAGSILMVAKDIASPDIWVTLNGWTTDYQRYMYRPKNEEFILENLSSQAEYPEYSDLIVEEILVPSHDGVMVPLSLIYPKELQKDGNNPVFFLGYGAYGMSMNPFFSSGYLLPTTKGSIFAIAHVRGGGELGDAWHKAGQKTTKPNTWMDLIACAEYLVAENYSSPKKMGIYSASAGGVLIGRAMTERPDLFAVAISEVGCMNTMRMEFTPNGPPNIPEFGTVKDSVECTALFEMDAYQQVVDGEKYPATLVTAGMNDPRVTVWEPAKFAARLQAANDSDKPILFAVDFEAGHGMGDTKTTYFESMADVVSFFLWQTGNPEFQEE